MAALSTDKVLATIAPSKYGGGGNKENKKTSDKHRNKNKNNEEPSSPVPAFALGSFPSGHGFSVASDNSQDGHTGVGFDDDDDDDSYALDDQDKNKNGDDDERNGSGSGHHHHSSSHHSHHGHSKVVSHKLEAGLLQEVCRDKEGVLRALQRKLPRKVSDGIHDASNGPATYKAFGSAMAASKQKSGGGGSGGGGDRLSPSQLMGALRLLVTSASVLSQNTDVDEDEGNGKPPPHGSPVSSSSSSSSSGGGGNDDLENGFVVGEFGSTKKSGGQSSSPSSDPNTVRVSLEQCQRFAAVVSGSGGGSDPAEGGVSVSRDEFAEYVRVVLVLGWFEAQGQTGADAVQRVLKQKQQQQQQRESESESGVGNGSSSVASASSSAAYSSANNAGHSVATTRTMAMMMDGSEGGDEDGFRGGGGGSSCHGGGSSRRGKDAEAQMDLDPFTEEVTIKVTRFKSTTAKKYPKKPPPKGLPPPSSSRKSPSARKSKARQALLTNEQDGETRSAASVDYSLEGEGRHSVDLSLDDSLASALSVEGVVESSFPAYLGGAGPGVKTAATVAGGDGTAGRGGDDGDDGEAAASVHDPSSARGLEGVEWEAVEEDAEFITEAVNEALAAAVAANNKPQDKQQELGQQQQQQQEQLGDGDGAATQEQLKASEEAGGEEVKEKRDDDAAADEDSDNANESPSAADVAAAVVVVVAADDSNGGGEEEEAVEPEGAAEGVWEAHWSEEYGCFYFYNYSEEATVWEPPVPLESVRKAVAEKKTAFFARLKEDVKKKKVAAGKGKESSRQGVSGGGAHKSSLQLAQEEAAAREAALLQAQALILANVEKLEDTVASLRLEQQQALAAATEQALQAQQEATRLALQAAQVATARAEEVAAEAEELATKAALEAARLAALPKLPVPTVPTPSNLDPEELEYLVRQFAHLQVKGLNSARFEKAVSVCMLDMPNTAFGVDDLPRKKDLAKAFGLADADKSGVVDIDEFVELYSRIKSGQVDGLAGYGFFEKKKHYTRSPNK